jgi:hypothetical protein
MNLDNILWLAGVLIEAAVVGLLLFRHVWKKFPIFFLYCVWDLLGTAGLFIIERRFPNTYLTFYLVQTAVDSALEFGVLVELAWSVLRPIRESLPRTALIVVGALILAAGVAIWPFSGIHDLANLSPQLRTLVRLEQTASILRILFFLVLAGCSQLLSIGWRDRELQIATGLGFYSFVSLAVEMLQSHQAYGPQYLHLQEIVVVSTVCSLSYWIFSFAQKEAERREFTPQMQNFLLAMAGTARTTRIAMMDSTGHKTRKRDE